MRLALQAYQDAARLLERQGWDRMPPDTAAADEPGDAETGLFRPPDEAEGGSRWQAAWRAPGRLFGLAGPDPGQVVRDVLQLLRAAGWDSWPLKNRRRIRLIDKEFDEGLTAQEERELRWLQAEADRHLEAVAPLPVEALDRLREGARRDGLRLGE